MLTQAFLTHFFPASAASDFQECLRSLSQESGSSSPLLPTSLLFNLQQFEDRQLEWAEQNTGIQNPPKMETKVSKILGFDGWEKAFQNGPVYTTDFWMEKLQGKEGHRGGVEI